MLLSKFGSCLSTADFELFLRLELLLILVGYACLAILAKQNLDFLRKAMIVL